MNIYKRLPLTSNWRYADLVKAAKLSGGPDKLIERVSKSGELVGAGKALTFVASVIVVSYATEKIKRSIERANPKPTIK